MAALRICRFYLFTYLLFLWESNKTFSNTIDQSFPLRPMPNFRQFHPQPTHTITIHLIAHLSHPARSQQQTIKTNKLVSG